MRGHGGHSGQGAALASVRTALGQPVPSPAPVAWTQQQGAETWQFTRPAMQAGDRRAHLFVFQPRLLLSQHRLRCRTCLHTRTRGAVWQSPAVNASVLHVTWLDTFRTALAC